MNRNEKPLQPFIWQCNQCDLWNNAQSKRVHEFRGRVNLDCKHCRKRIEIMYNGYWKVNNHLFTYHGDAKKQAIILNLEKENKELKNNE